MAWIIIPARYRSERFPGKALALLAGEPLIRHVCAGALKASSSVCVAVDDERVAAAVSHLPVRVVMTDQNLASGSDRVARAATVLGLDEDEIVINLQGDLPWIDPQLIRAVVAALEEDASVMVSTPVAPQRGRRGDCHDPNTVRAVLDRNNNALYFSRAPIPWSRDDEDIIWRRHIGVYGFRNRTLQRFVSLTAGVLEKIEKLEQLRLLEAGIPIRCVPGNWATAEVNTHEDLISLQKLVSLQNKE
jgi:3-deoxy-manno-octulosonate cytidylyltransferase (CMP-KDO synthetase)